MQRCKINSSINHRCKVLKTHSEQVVCEIIGAARIIQTTRTMRQHTVPTANKKRTWAVKRALIFTTVQECVCHTVCKPRVLGTCGDFMEGYMKFCISQNKHCKSALVVSPSHLVHPSVFCTVTWEMLWCAVFIKAMLCEVRGRNLVARGGIHKCEYDRLWWQG